MSTVTLMNDDNDSPEPDFATLGGRLRWLIDHRLDVTHVEFAKMAKTGTPTLSRWVNNVNVPQPGNVARIVKLTGVSRGWLLTGEGEPFPAVITLTPQDVTVDSNLEVTDIAAAQGSKAGAAPGSNGGAPGGQGDPQMAAMTREWVEQLRDIRLSGGTQVEKALRTDAVASAIGRFAWALGEISATDRARAVISGDDEARRRAASGAPTVPPAPVVDPESEKGGERNVT